MAEGPQTAGSLRRRLMVILTGGAAVLAVLLFVVIRSYATQIAQQSQDSILRAAATSILDAARLQNGRVEVDIPYAAFSMLTTPQDDRLFYAIFEDAALVSGYPGLAEPLESASVTRFRSGPFLDTEVRVVTAARTLIGATERTTVTVALAQTQDALAGTLARIARTATLLGAGFFALATILAFWATARTISPLGRLTHAVTRRGPQDLSPFEKPVPSEMVPLVSSLNSLMGRLDQSLNQSEDFIAEAAHRVRTPLATVRSYAEATLQRVDKEENRQALRSMVRAIDEAARAAGQLLDHAMITFRADHLDRQNVDLADIARELILRLSPIADMKDLTLVQTGADRAPFAGDPILLQNALRNLLDNALKYAPAESSVTVEITDGAHPRIAVRDAGAGFPPGDLPTLDARFTRGGNSTGIIGSGLGLTIARDVAEAHGGNLTLTNLKEGGACAELSF